MWPTKQMCITFRQYGGWIYWHQSFTFVYIHTLCHVTLQFLSLEAGYISPYCLQSFVILFGQKDIIGHRARENLKYACAVGLALLHLCSHHEKNCPQVATARSA